MNTEPKETYSTFDYVAYKEKLLIGPVLVALFFLSPAIGGGIWLFYFVGISFIFHFGLQLAWSMVRGRSWMSPEITKNSKPLWFWFTTILTLLFFLASIVWTGFLLISHLQVKPV